MNVDALLAAVRRLDWNAIESGRDHVDADTLERLLESYSTLETWHQKVAFASVVQDSRDPRLREIMLDVLRAPVPADNYLDIIECTKAVALGFVDEKYDRFQHYYDDREALHAAVREVLGDAAPTPPSYASEPAQLPDGEPPLLGACVAGRRDIALSEIANGADIHATRIGGQTALYWAAIHGWLDVARALLQRGAAVDQADHYGSTPLHQAVRSSAPVTRELLAAGANPRAAYQDGRTPVWFAGNAGHVDIVRELLAAGVGIDELHAETTLLALACRENHVALVEELVARGANVNLPVTSFGARLTPLMIAAQSGLPTIVRALLAAGAHRAQMIDGRRATDVATGRYADEIRALLA